MQTHDDDLHIGSDFERVYVMTNAPDLSGAKAIMKIRSLNDVFDFECQGQQLDVTDGRLEYVQL